MSPGPVLAFHGWDSNTVPMTRNSLTTHFASDRGLLSLTLNRLQVHNALDDALIDELTAALANATTDPAVRIILLRGAEDRFCAGMDISWMKRMAGSGPSDDARRLSNMLLMLKQLPKPTIALIEGCCLGAGVALASCCDIAIAAEESFFALPAVHLGAAPAVVAPFVVGAIGLHQTKRYCLTGERFTADTARDLGLVHAVCMGARLDETAAVFVDHLLRGGPRALADTKSLLSDYDGKPLSRDLVEDAARRTGQSRRSAEAQEGLSAFLEKRVPAWRQGSEN